MNRRLKTTLFAILPLFIAILLVAPALSQQKPGALKDAPSPEEKEDEGSLEDEAPPIGKVPTVEDIAKRQEKQKKKFQQLEALLHRLADLAQVGRLGLRREPHLVAHGLEGLAEDGLALHVVAGRVEDAHPAHVGVADQLHPVLV